MIKKLKLIMLAGLLISSRPLLAQEKPTVIPPSPTAVQFQRYGDYPVNYFNGLPDITIPIYTIKDGDITVPITISYHGSGTRADDVSGFVGLGWTLNTGGMISRTINGLPDESYPMEIPSVPAQSIDYTQSNFYWSLRYTNEGIYDSQYDVFSYNFLGHSGKYIKYTPNGPLQLKASNLKIVDNIITDDNGISYLFGSAPEYQEYNDKWSLKTCYSTWHLSAIGSSKYPTSTVYYSYQDGNAYVYDKYYADYMLDDAWIPNSNNAYDYTYSDINSGGISQGANLIRYYTSNIKEIVYSGGKVRFNQDPATKMLTSIEVFDKANVLLKTITLNITAFPTAFGLDKFSNYKLQSITFKDQNNADVETYNFNYNMELAMDAKPKAFNPYAGRDHWGFYNGDYSITGLPAYPNYTVFVDNNGVVGKTVGGTANKSANSSAMVYTLNKITYPTGGSTIFEFENNQQVSGGFDYVGGLRIKKISSYLNSSQLASERSFNYNSSDQEVVPNTEMYMYNVSGGVYSNPSRRLIIKENLPFDASPQGSAIVYPSVTEVNGSRVTNYTYDSGDAYTYQSHNYPGSIPPQLAGFMPKRFTNNYKPWNFGNLLSKSEIDNANSLEELEEYEYEEFMLDTLRDFIIEKSSFLECSLTSTGCTLNINSEEPYLHSIGYSVYNFADHFYLSGGKRLKKQTNTTIRNGVHLSTVTNLLYDNPLWPISVTSNSTTNSKGEIITNSMKYAFDYPGNVTYQGMVERNLVGDVIETTQVNTSLGEELSRVKANYAYFNSSTLIALSNVQKSFLGGPLDTEFTIDSYDANGNVSQVTGKDGIPTTFIYGYNSKYPVAKIVGLDHATSSTYFNQPVLDNYSISDAVLHNQFNGIRTLPNVLVSTYTYQPLVGMTSQTDAKGMTTYYEYDSFQRLLNVKDQNGNIIKSNAYHYRQP